MSGGVKKEISTNAQKGSVCRVDVPPVTFDALWAAYPAGKPYVDPKTGKPPPGSTNQCAIKVSVALHGAGVELKSFTGNSISSMERPPPSVPRSWRTGSRSSRSAAYHQGRRP